jgi:hypothetical protein
MNKPDVTIAVDGSLFRYHPRLQVMLEVTLKNLINPLNKVYKIICFTLVRVDLSFFVLLRYCFF